MKVKNIVTFFALILISALLTFIGSAFRYDTKMHVSLDMAHSMFQQKVVSTLQTPKKVNVLYYQNQLVGVISDEKKLDELLNDVYKERYEKKYPNKKLGLSDDIHYAYEYTLEQYENKDKEIFSFINKEDLFSIEAQQISFSNGSVMYVNDLNDFEEAKEKYILYYVDEKSYRNISKEKTNKLEGEYGRIVTSFYLDEKTAINKDFTSENKILKNSDEIVEWFIQGYDDTKLTYTVEDGDTIQGVASKSGVEVNNLMITNKTILHEQNQLLEPGTKINVKGVVSPINFKVEKEATNKVTIYPDNTEYIEDATLALGVEKVVQEEVLGYRKVVMKEIYNNGVMIDSEELSSQVLSTPQKKIIRIGTKESDDGNKGSLNTGIISAGNFRYPVENPRATCKWMCYRNHEALDVQNAYNKYGEVYAADSGVVRVNSYNGINGYWIEIDHENGFVTYYGHMNEKGYIEEGERVEKGQVIGQIGMTGLATGPHVHFEVRYKGKKMDPSMYLR